MRPLVGHHPQVPGPYAHVHPRQCVPCMPRRPVFHVHLHEYVSTCLLGPRRKLRSNSTDACELMRTATQMGESTTRSLSKAAG